MSDAGDGRLPSPPEPTSDERGEVHVLGTAHVSQRSVEDVHETVDREQPDVVAIELDEGRYRQLRGGAPDDLDAADLLSGNTVFQFLAYWMLSYVQSRLGDQFDIEPGADMRAGIEAADRNGLGLALVDRDIQVTMQRFWARISLTEKARMVGSLALGVTDPRTIGLTFGGAIGAFVGVVFAGFVAPVIGLGDVLALGLAGTGIFPYIGAIGWGVFGGILLGLLFVPTIAADRGPIGGFAARILVGILVGVGGLLALVATGTYPGPIDVTTFTSAGGFVVHALVGFLAGVGVGAALGLLFGTFLGSLGGDVEELDEIDVEDITDGDVVAAMMEEFRRFSPRGAEALIDERDAFIAHKLDALREQGYDVVAVVGAGHRAGIERYLADPESLPSMDSITGTASGRRFSIMKLGGYLIMVGFVGFFFLLLMAGVRNLLLLKLFLAWVVFNGLFAFTLARLAGARWTSAGVGGAVAWLTSINPLLAPGWFAGYVELRKRPVNVRDIQTLNELLDDTERPAGELVEEMFSVPLFRLIMIVAFTNVGSMIATFLFPVVVMPWFGAEIGGVAGLTTELLEGARNSVELLVEVFR